MPFLHGSRWMNHRFLNLNSFWTNDRSKLINLCNRWRLTSIWLMINSSIDNKRKFPSQSLFVFLYSFPKVNSWILSNFLIRSLDISPALIMKIERVTGWTCLNQSNLTGICNPNSIFPNKNRWTHNFFERNSVEL